MALHLQKWIGKREKVPWNENNVLVVTGASSGIGREIALAYAMRRCTLVLAARSYDKLCKVAEQCEELGSRAFPIECDVTKEEDCKKVMETTVEKYGKIDILVLCSGVGSHHLFRSSTSTNVFRTLMETNFYGYLNLTRYAFEYLRQSHGMILCVSSLAGEMGLPFRTAYCASKFAITGFFEALRSELDMAPDGVKDQIDIVMVCPPSTKTNFRKNNIKDGVELHQLPNESQLSVQQCVEVIIDAADRRLRKVYFPLNIYIGVYLRPFFPDLVDYFAKKKSSRL